jgi:hypothetical protein
VSARLGVLERSATAGSAHRSYSVSGTCPRLRAVGFLPVELVKLYLASLRRMNLPE